MNAGARVLRLHSRSSGSHAPAHAIQRNAHPSGRATFTTMDARPALSLGPHDSPDLEAVLSLKPKRGARVVTSRHALRQCAHGQGRDSVVTDGSESMQSNVTGGGPARGLRSVVVTGISEAEDVGAQEPRPVWGRPRVGSAPDVSATLGSCTLGQVSTPASQPPRAAASQDCHPRAGQWAHNSAEQRSTRSIHDVVRLERSQSVGDHQPPRARHATCVLVGTVAGSRSFGTMVSSSSLQASRGSSGFGRGNARMLTHTPRATRRLMLGEAAVTHERGHHHLSPLRRLTKAVSRVSVELWDGVIDAHAPDAATISDSSDDSYEDSSDDNSAGEGPKPGAQPRATLPKPAPKHSCCRRVASTLRRTFLPGSLESRITYARVQSLCGSGRRRLTTSGCVLPGCEVQVRATQVDPHLPCHDLRAGPVDAGWADARPDNILRRVPRAVLWYASSNCVAPVHRNGTTNVHPRPDVAQRRVFGSAGPCSASCTHCRRPEPC